MTDTALKVSRSLYCFTTSISHGVENYFPRLWGTGISDAIFIISGRGLAQEGDYKMHHVCVCVRVYVSVSRRFLQNYCS